MFSFDRTHKTNKYIGYNILPYEVNRVIVEKNTNPRKRNRVQLNLSIRKRPKLVFKTNYLYMQVKSIAVRSKGSILQYFRPSLCYHLSIRSLFCLFLGGRLRHVLLYFVFAMFQCITMKSHLQQQHVVEYRKFVVLETRCISNYQLFEWT